MATTKKKVTRKKATKKTAAKKTEKKVAARRPSKVRQLQERYGLNPEDPRDLFDGKTQVKKIFKQGHDAKLKSLGLKVARGTEKPSVLSKGQKLYLQDKGILK